MKLAIIGGTGLVGSIILKVLEERKFPVKKLFVVASERSIGQKITFKKRFIEVIGLEECLELKPDIALFSTGVDISLKWAPKFVNVGAIVIDNSTAWRMDATKKLIVPEINGDILTPKDTIIANPNCSTIQLVMIIAPLHKVFGIKRIVISTYQSVTGTGIKAVQQLKNEYKNISTGKVYPHPIYQNVLPHCDIFQENGYTKEEMKLVNETHKILNDRNIGISATAVRVPVIGGHSESVNISFKKAFDLTQIKKILEKAKGVIVRDAPDKNSYPMPINAEGKDDVFVGRIRKDFSQKNTLNLWIVADNLRKGAATNAVQIAEILIKK